MLIQMHLDPLDARGLKAYRLQVKERLYRFNFVRIFGQSPFVDANKVSVGGAGADGEGRAGRKA